MPLTKYPADSPINDGYNTDPDTESQGAFPIEDRLDIALDLGCVQYYRFYIRSLDLLRLYGKGCYILKANFFSLYEADPGIMHANFGRLDLFSAGLVHFYGLGIDIIRTGLVHFYGLGSDILDFILDQGNAFPFDLFFFTWHG